VSPRSYPKKRAAAWCPSVHLYPAWPPGESQVISQEASCSLQVNLLPSPHLYPAWPPGESQVISQEVSCRLQVNLLPAPHLYPAWPPGESQVISQEASCSLLSSPHLYPAWPPGESQVISQEANSRPGVLLLTCTLPGPLVSPRSYPKKRTAGLVSFCSPVPCLAPW
jgi:hypothetical protein